MRRSDRREAVFELPLYPLRAGRAARDAQEHNLTPDQIKRVEIGSIATASR